MAETSPSPSSSTSVAPTDVSGNVAQENASIVETLIEALPRLAIAAAVIVVAIIVGRLLKRFLEPRLTKRRTESFGRVISSIISGTVIALGFVTAVTVLFPSVSPVTIISGLGVFSIAIGFAFQDILSNMLAGLLLLIRQPFQSGDQIEVSGERGTVQAITIRETQIKTFEGEKVLIPNAEVYQSIITVQTAYGPKRTSVVIGLEDHEDLDAAADIIVAATEGIEGVESEPAPQAYFFEFGDWSTNLQLRYWTQPDQANVRAVQDRVIRSVGRALRDNDIPMPSPITEIDARDSLSAVLGSRGDNDQASARQN